MVKASLSESLFLAMSPNWGIPERHLDGTQGFTAVFPDEGRLDSHLPHSQAAYITFPDTLYILTLCSSQMEWLQII